MDLSAFGFYEIIFISFQIFVIFQNIAGIIDSLQMSAQLPFLPFSFFLFYAQLFSYQISSTATSSYFTRSRYVQTFVNISVFS